MKQRSGASASSGGEARPTANNCYLCALPVFGMAAHPCCERWWDGHRCLACEASRAAAHGEIWRSHGKLRSEMERDRPPLAR